MARGKDSGGGRGVADQRAADDRRADDALAPDQGLDAATAAARLRRYGPNTIAEEERRPLLELLFQFWARSGG